MSKRSEELVAVRNDEVEIRNLVIKDENAASFLHDKKDKAEWTRKAIIVGCVGLKGITVGENVDYVEKRFQKLLTEIENKFEKRQKNFDERMDQYFSEKRTDSPVYKLYKLLDEKEKGSPFSALTKRLEEYFGDKDGKVKRIMRESFDTTNTKTPLGQLKHELDGYFREKDGKLYRMLDIEEAGPMGHFNKKFDRYLDPRTGEIKQLLDKNFDIDNQTSMLGRFSKKLEDNFDVKKGSIRQLLDPHDVQSPIGQMHKEIADQLKEIHDALVAEAQRDMDAESSTQKGYDFEDEIQMQLEEMVRYHPFERVQKVSEENGVDKNKSGDFLVDIGGDVEKRIAIEAKAREINEKVAYEQINQMLTNREAKFGILLFRDNQSMPKKMRPIKILPNGIVTSFDTHGLYFAVHIARLFFDAKGNRNEGVDAIKIKEITETIKNKMYPIAEMKKQATTIENSAEYIKCELKKLEDGVMDDIDQIGRCLDKGKQTGCEASGNKD